MVSKILFILPGLDAGGAERVLITLMNGVNRQKYNSVLLSVQRDGPLKKLVDPAIPTHTLNQKLSPLSLPLLFWKIRTIKPDIVVSTMAHMNFAVLALKPFFPNTVFIVREAITPSFLFGKYIRLKWLIKFLYQKLYSRADIIVSPSQKIFDEFHHELDMNWDNFVVLKNPVHTANIRGSIDFSSIPDGQGQTVHFVACGRLCQQKGFDRLIEALSQLKLSHRWRLYILGEGPERAFLKTLIQKEGLQNQVFLKGLVMPPYSHLAQADAFLMPSRFEGLPNVVLEALACGTPVIATQESGGIEEIARDCPQDSVQIVQDMRGFIQAMDKIKPCAKTMTAPSLLAECYDQVHVLQSFEDILDGLFLADTGKLDHT